MMRIPLFAPANRRKARPIPAADPKPAVPVEQPKPKPPIRVSPPPPAPAELRATGPLATDTPYGKPTAEIPHWQTEAIGTEWLTTETQRLHDLAALGGDHTAHQTIADADAATEALNAGELSTWARLIARTIPIRTPPPA